MHNSLNTKRFERPILMFLFGRQNPNTCHIITVSWIGFNHCLELFSIYLCAALLREERVQARTCGRHRRFSHIEILARARSVYVSCAHSIFQIAECHQKPIIYRELCSTAIGISFFFQAYSVVYNLTQKIPTWTAYIEHTASPQRLAFVRN